MCRHINLEGDGKKLMGQMREKDKEIKKKTSREEEEEKSGQVSTGGKSMSINILSNQESEEGKMSRGGAVVKEGDS